MNHEKFLQEGSSRPNLRKDHGPDIGSENCKKAFSLFTSMLPMDISKVELEAMFCRAGKIIDTFIPIDRRTGKKRGIGFVRFKTAGGFTCY